jgi:hypothetical protein
MTRWPRWITVALVRSAIRGLLRAAGSDLAGELRGVLRCDDDYATAGKPACDYEDRAAREELIDALGRGRLALLALLAVLEGRELEPPLAQAAKLLATVTGKDLEQDAAGVFRIARRVAADRIILAVDPMPGTGTRSPPAASMATRGISRLTRARKSSPPRRPRRETAETPRSLRASSLTCSPVTRTVPRARTAVSLRRWRRTMAGRRFTGMPPTAPASSSGGWTAPASITVSNASRRPR